MSAEPANKPVLVDFVLDVGNSRTCGILIESYPNERSIDLNNSLVLQLRDLSRPEFTYNEPFESQVFTGVVTWELNFTHPSTGGSIGLVEATIAEDEYRIYAGATSLPEPTLGQGGYGVWSRDASGSFTQAEFNEYVQIRDTFENAVSTRGEETGFAAWGGSISFDNDGSTIWHFNHTTAPTAGESDLFSVAIHELGHALGLGASDEWTALAAGSGDSAYFTGAAAYAEYGGYVPLAADKAHWREGTASTVFGTSTIQEAAMDPSLTTGTRKRLTALDAATISDIGWTVVLPGDFNGNNVVDAADYTVWRDGLGSEYNGSHYTLWKSNFGRMAGSGAGAGDVAAVPEPDGVFALLSASAVVFGRFFLPRRPRR